MNPNFPWTKPWELFSLRILGYHRVENVRMREALHIYRSCKEFAMNPTLRRHLRSLPQTFQSEHQLILLPVWILHNRMLIEGKPGKQMDHEIFNCLWLNTERRARFWAPELPEVSFSKNQKEIQKLSFGAMCSYDVGLSVVNDGNHDLASALFRNLWQNDEKRVNEKEVYQMAKWLRKQVKLATSPSEFTFQQLCRNEYKFQLPSGFEPNGDDVIKSEELGLTGKYRQELDIKGRRYWWDVDTRQVFWERPNKK